MLSDLKAIGFTRRYGVHCRCLFDLVQIMPQLRFFCGVIIREVVPAQAAVGGGHDPLGADQGREALDAVGHELGVLQHVGGVGDDAGDEVLALGQGHIPPDPPLVLVADVGRLEAQPVGVHAQGQVDDLVEAEVGGVRAVPQLRSEERRVGKECRSRWSTYH